MRIIKLAMELQVKQLSPTEWDAFNDRYDFHIRLEEDEWAIDAFNVYERNNDKAHLDSCLGEADTFEQALQMCREFNGSFTPPLDKLKFPPGFGKI